MGRGEEGKLERAGWEEGEEERMFGEVAVMKQRDGNKHEVKKGQQRQVTVNKKAKSNQLQKGQLRQFTVER